MWECLFFDLLIKSVIVRLIFEVFVSVAASFLKLGVVFLILRFLWGVL